MYQPRLLADQAYIEALGRAFYAFTYLEWVVIWTIVKLSSDGFASVPRGKSAIHIANAFAGAIARTSPPPSRTLRRNLVKFEESYRSAISTRNQLLHAHPYTAPDGAQQLRGGSHEWPIARVYEALEEFEAAAIAGNAIFHGDLAAARKS